VYNTHHIECSPELSTHAESWTDEEDSRALIAADNTEIDWRKQIDGHLMAKKLRDIELQETEYRKTRMRPSRKHDEWSTELEMAMKDIPSLKKCAPVYQASSYDTGNSPLPYEDFTSQAQWNFRHDRRPVSGIKDHWPSQPQRFPPHHT
jgi:hypothetical protein